MLTPPLNAISNFFAMLQTSNRELEKKKKIKSMQAALACRSHMRLTGSHQLCLIGNLLQLAQNVLVTVHEAQNQIVDLRFLAKLSDELL